MLKVVYFSNFTFNENNFSALDDDRYWRSIGDERIEYNIIHESGDLSSTESV